MLGATMRPLLVSSDHCGDHDDMMIRLLTKMMMIKFLTKSKKKLHNCPKQHQKWPFMTPNGPKTLLMGIIYDIMSCWTTLGPFQRPS